MVSMVLVAVMNAIDQGWSFLQLFQLSVELQNRFYSACLYLVT